MVLFALEGAYNAPTFPNTYVTLSCLTVSKTFSLDDLTTAHTPSSPGSTDHSIRSQRRVLDFACTLSPKECIAQISFLQNFKTHRGYQIEATIPTPGTL